MITEAASRGAKLLMVDDQEVNLRMVGGILNRLGFDFTPATSGDAALAMMERQSFDLILLDVLMPDRDGFEICQAIRRNPLWTDIPVIFLSAADDKDMIVRALEAGGVDYITKPFNAAELVSRVRTHIALKVTRDALKQLAEDKDELLGILAHDLKNHLGGIKMSAEALQTSVANKNNLQVASLAANIHVGTDQMFAFVVEFLANSAADRGYELRSEPVWMDDLVASAVEHYGETARRKRITLVHSGKVSEPMAADRNAVNQILHNLISNAVKFSPAGTTVRVRVETDEAGATVCSVQDEGPGFSADDKARMFRRYQRLSAQPTADEPSTGLGLSIVKKLLYHVGGNIACEDRAGGGTTFTIRFPAAPVAAVAASQASTAAANR
jgi:two-component system, sensor histidine kinase and response regulator